MNCMYCGCRSCTCDSVEKTIDPLVRYVIRFPDGTFSGKEKSHVEFSKARLFALRRYVVSHLRHAREYEHGAYVVRVLLHPRFERLEYASAVLDRIDATKVAKKRLSDAEKSYRNAKSQYDALSGK